MAVCLLKSVWDIFKMYVHKPIRTDTYQDVSDVLPFPAVTLCNRTPYNKTRMNASEALKSFFLHNSNLGYFQEIMNFSDPRFTELTVPGSPEWFPRVASSINCQVCLSRGSESNCNDLLVKHVTEWDVCLTYNSWAHVKKSGRSINNSQTGSYSVLIVYMKVDQDNYVFNENMAAGIKVSVAVSKIKISDRVQILVFISI